MNDDTSPPRCPVDHGATGQSYISARGRLVEVRPRPQEAPPEIPGLDLVDPDLYVAGVPFEHFRRLRAEAPVYWHPETEGSGFWAITRYADVVHVSLNHRIFSSGKRGCFLFDPPPDDLVAVQMMMVNMDQPRHGRLRSLVNKGFAPRMMNWIEPKVREACRKIVDAVAPHGECDFVRDVAAELPLVVIAEMLGVPLEDRQQLYDWSNRLMGFDDPEFQTSMEDGKIAASEMYAYTNQLAETRRGSPREDLVSVLMNAEVDGEKLSELEFDLFVLLLAVAGNETTRNGISGGMLQLMDNPDQHARLLADPSLVPSAIEEMLRTVTPVMHFRRTALVDTEIRGQKIREGDKVVVWYPSANRDETVFEDPDRFDVARTPNDHLAFGLGQHFCLGANLARLEMRVMFEEILRRIPDVKLAGPERRRRSNFINGRKSMPVTFTPESAARP
jgi:cholest-4-en-3-one 26-monooxygenase